MSVLFTATCAAQATRISSAVRAGVPPQIDGKLDDACWTGARVLDGFTIYSDANSPHAESTSARICFDDDHLYLAIQGSVADFPRYRQAVVDGGNKFDYYRGGGTIEVFLDPHGAGKSFQQFLMHVNGSSQATAPSGDLLSVLNLTYVKFKTALTDSGFVIEAAIPLAMLHPRGDAKEWGFNITRCHELYLESLEPDRLFSAWNNTRGKPFQDATQFGRLTVDADLSPFAFEVNLPQEPRIGDSKVNVVVQNWTGKPFDGRIELEVSSSGEQPKRYELPLKLGDDDQQEIEFPSPVNSVNISAEYRFTIRDTAGRVRWLGGTQKTDLTPADAWQPPVAGDQSQKRGYLLFHRSALEPVTYRSVPRTEEITEQISLSASAGQWESETLSFYPLRDIKSLSIEIGDLVSDQGHSIPANNIELRKVTYQSVWKDMRQFESIEHLLRRFDTLQLDAGCSQRIVVITRVPDDALPGTYKSSLTISADGISTQVPVSVRVLPFKLAQTDGIGYFMYFPGVPSGIFGDPEFFEKIVGDMRDHGMTTTTLYHSCQTTNSQGEAIVDVDGLVDPKFGVTYAQMIELISRAGLGKHAPLIDVSAMHMVREPKLLADLQAIYDQRGWPDVAFYIEDEIDFPERIERARVALTGLKEVAPNVTTATAMGMKGADALGHLYDIWIGCSRLDLRDKCLEMGKQPWTYSCRPLYETSPAFVRYFYGQFVWNMGLRGIGLWSYAEHDRFTDRFGRMHPYEKDTVFQPEWKHDYGHVVFEGREIVPTVTWEGVRQGINDYRYLITLAQWIDQAPVGSAAAARGKELLESIRQQFNPEIGIMDLQYGRDWKAVGDLTGLRAQVIEATVALYDEHHQN